MIPWIAALSAIYTMMRFDYHLGWPVVLTVTVLAFIASSFCISFFQIKGREQLVPWKYRRSNKIQCCFMIALMQFAIPTVMLIATSLIGDCFFDLFNKTVTLILVVWALVAVVILRMLIVSKKQILDEYIPDPKRFIFRLESDYKDKKTIRRLLWFDSNDDLNNNEPSGLTQVLVTSKHVGGIQAPLVFVYNPDTKRFLPKQE